MSVADYASTVPGPVTRSLTFGDLIETSKRVQREKVAARTRSAAGQVSADGDRLTITPLERFTPASPLSPESRPALVQSAPYTVDVSTGELLDLGPDLGAKVAGRVLRASATGGGSAADPAADARLNAVSSTPLSNTGCQTPTPTAGPEGIVPKQSRVLVDYLGCTFSPRRNGDGTSVEVPEEMEPLNLAKSMFHQDGCDDWVELDKGGYAYSNSMRRGDVTIYYGGQHTRGTVYVHASGKGCRQLEEEGVVTGARLLTDPSCTRWQAFLAELVELGVTFARIDFAIDEVEGRLSVDDIHNAVMSGDCVTRFRSYEPRATHDPSTGALTGLTLYWGQRGSNMFVRIYHKGLEQVSKGYSEEVADWVRVELEAKNDRADKLVQAVISRGVDAVLEALWNYVEFKDPDDRDTEDDAHRCRRNTVAWWRDWLQACQRLKLGCDPKTFSVDKAKAWFTRSVAPTLAVLAYAGSAGWEWIEAQIKEAATHRLRRHHWAMLADAAGVTGGLSGIQGSGFAGRALLDY